MELARAQAARIEEQDRRAAEQDRQIEALRLELDRLKRLLTRNSGNSSLPPSGDDAPGRKRPARRQRRGSGRRRGKQPGGDGSGLRWVEDAEVVDHFPEGTCACGADLAGAVDLGVARSHQVHDVPLVTVNVTQHDLHRVRCGSGREHVAARPGDVPASPSSYGANLRALVVYLLLYQHVPVERCAWLVADLTGAKPSTGFIHGMPDTRGTRSPTRTGPRPGQPPPNPVVLLDLQLLRAHETAVLQTAPLKINNPRVHSMSPHTRARH